jgi:hypothetical protein
MIFESATLIESRRSFPPNKRPPEAVSRFQICVEKWASIGAGFLNSDSRGTIEIDGSFTPRCNFHCGD